MKSITDEIDKRASRILGMQAQLDYIVNDMLDSTKRDLNPKDRFFENDAYADRISLKTAIPVLENLRGDLDDIQLLLQIIYAPVCEFQKSEETCTS